MRRILFSVILASSVFLSCSKPDSPGPPDPPTPISITDTTSNEWVFAASSNNTFYAFDAKNGKIRWTFPLNDTGVYTVIVSSPAFLDSTLYVSSSDRHIYAIDAYTGKEKWRYLTGSPAGIAWSSPVVANGTVYVGCEDRNFYALNARTGALVWKRTFTREIESSPTVVDNTVYASCDNDTLYALNASTGTTRWAYKHFSFAFATSSPCVSKGIVYAIADGEYSGTVGNSALFVLNASNGQYVGGRSGYTLPPFSASLSSPIVDNDRIVYITGQEGTLYAINTYAPVSGTSQLVWSYDIGEEFYASPIFDDSCVYAVDNVAILYAFNKFNGTLKWKVATEPGSFRTFTSPVIANGIIYIGSTRGISAVNARTGEILWKSPTNTTNAFFESSPCVVTNKGVAFHSAISGMRN